MADRKRLLKILTILISALMLLAGCGTGGAESSDAGAESSGKVMILYTSDIHCGVDKGFGLAGLQAVRDSYEARGYETILVDDGDAIQGESIGALSEGEAVIELMNAMKYDVAIPGNHEFDYSVTRFLELAEKADYPYISCNFTKDGELLFDPYVIKEAGGMKIAFVGVTTPWTLTSSDPDNFRNENGELVYGFTQGGDGEDLYKAVQDAVDSARAEGADYVYVMAHLGYEESYSPWAYADVISHTNGIDVFLDGHSHDMEQVVMKNKDGKDVVRTACGTKLQAIGYSEISAEEGILDTNIWTWNNDVNAYELLGIDNDIKKTVDSSLAELNKTLDQVIGTASTDLTTDDPVETFDDGSPVRIVRRGETNLGDLCADAIRIEMGADIGFCGGGSVRTNVGKGDITYGDIIEVFPFNNEMITVDVTGQQVLDALEWSASRLPEEFGGFLQVSGLTLEIDMNVESTCTWNEEGQCTGISGERRVRNVMVGGRAIDPDAMYTVAGQDFLLLHNGDGYTAFDGAENIVYTGKLDNEILIDYIKDTLGGETGDAYSDPYGSDRITIIQQE